MDSYITWPYQIANHYSRITWVYNKSQSNTENTVVKGSGHTEIQESQEIQI